MQYATNYNDYLDVFQSITEKMHSGLLINRGLTARAGLYKAAAFIKWQKKHWSNSSPDHSSSDAVIFFSAWVDNQSIKENKLLFNIHAFKLRALKGYRLSSREFAAAFRGKFQAHAAQWPNASIAFGPLTLMEGWEALDTARVEETLTAMANRFSVLGQIIDDLLRERKKSSR